MDSSAVLTVTNLCFSYPDKADVLRKLSLRVRKGDRLGIVGSNGCGKTTFFLLICGLLTPDQGGIVILGKPVETGTFRSDVGLVFQNSDDQLFSPSVQDDVAFGVENMGLPPEEVTCRVAEALRLTGTQHLADRPPHHLSGGEKRMVAIAGVIAMRPQVVIYDEPTANLDLRARRRLIQFLQQCRETLLVSSHDLEFVLEMCDRVVVMHEGFIVADGVPRQIMSDPVLMETHGLEVPYSLIGRC